MQTSALDAPVSLLSNSQLPASHTSQRDDKSKRNGQVAHVRYVKGDDHLQLQLQVGSDHKTFFRSATENLDKLRHRLQIQAAQASTQAADGSGNCSHKQRKKKDQQHHALSPQFRVRFFTVLEEEIVNESISVCDALMRTERMTIGDTMYAVLHNQPRVTKVSVISPVLAEIPMVPIPETDFCKPEECVWRWYRIDSSGHESLVGDFRRYVPTAHDIGFYFRIECHAPSMDAAFAQDSTVEATTTPVVRGPDRAVFEPRKRLGTMRACGGDGATNVFRVMTYNVLFDGYATSPQAGTDIFPYVQPNVINEMYRMQLVFQEIAEANADIVCLQEMGEHAFHSFFEPMLTPLGYHAVYTGKTGTTNEGCAVLIRTDVFVIVEQHALAVSEEALRSEDAGVIALLSAYPELRKGLEKIPSIAQLLVLRDTRYPARCVLLANTHLFYREDADMIRVVQAVATVRAIERLQTQLVDSGHHAAIVFCGDFNAVPDSGTVEFLLDGAVDESHRHWQELRDFRWNRNGNNSEEPPPSDRILAGRIAHSLAFASACGIPEFTNFARTFVATLDYILLGQRELEVARVFPLFTRAQVSEETALPSTAFPSDHISLIADLRWSAV